MGGTVVLIDREGNPHEIATEKAGEAIDLGWRTQTDDDVRARATESAKEETYGGVRGVVGATGAALARGASLGGSDLVIRAIGGDDAAETLRGLKEQNQGVSLAGEVVGSLATGKLPAGAVTRVGANIARAGEGASIAARAGRAVGAGVFEGGAFGFGSGVSELAMSDKVSLEHAVSTLSSNTLLGAATGGGASLVAAGAGAVLRRGQQMLDNVASRADSPGAAAVEDVAAYQATLKDANPWLVMDEGSKAARLNSTTAALRKAMDDPAALTKGPQSVLKPLRIQQKALEETIAAADDITTKLGATSKKMAEEITEQVAKLATDVDEVVLSGRTARRYASFADVKLAKGKTLTVTREEAGAFAKALDDGQILGSGKQSLDKLGGLLEANKALQAKIEAGVAAKGGGGAQSLAQNMLGGQVFGMASSLAGMIPGLGAIPGFSQLAGSMASKFVTEGLGKLAEKQAVRASKAIGALLEVGEKLGPVAPVLSSKVLASVRYADSTPQPQNAPKQPKSKKKGGDAPTPKLSDSFLARTQELKSQTVYQGGGAVMRPEARAKLAKKFDAVRAADPVAADRMETAAVRRVEYLANQIPRQPDVMSTKTGPDRWQPGEMAMRKFARIAAVIEDPVGVVERLSNGSVTPEDRDTMKAVYPEMYADIQQQIFAQLPTLQKTLPFQKRIALSIFSGLPVDPAMHPRILRVLQRQFAQEPGSEGGTTAPTPQPQFGSVKAEQPTPGQQREQGATA